MNGSLFRRLLLLAIGLIALTLIVVDYQLRDYAAKREASVVTERLTAQVRILVDEIPARIADQKNWVEKAAVKSQARLALIGSDQLGHFGLLDVKVLLRLEHFAQSDHFTLSVRDFDANRRLARYAFNQDRLALQAEAQVLVQRDDAAVLDAGFWFEFERRDHRARIDLDDVAEDVERLEFGFDARSGVLELLAVEAGALGRLIQQIRRRQRVSAPARLRLRSIGRGGHRRHASLGFHLTNIIWRPKATPALERELGAEGFVRLDDAARRRIADVIETSDAVTVPWVLFIHADYRFNRAEYVFADPRTLDKQTDTRLNDTASMLLGIQLLARPRDPGYFFASTGN